MQEDLSLAKLDAARVAIEIAATVQEVKNTLDMLEMAKVYARQKKVGDDLKLKIEEYVVRAERKLGEMLKAAKAAGQITHAHKGDNLVVDGDDNKTVKLSDAGISRDLSSRAQKLASIPKEEFESKITGGKARGKISAKSMARLNGEGDAAAIYAAIKASANGLTCEKLELQLGLKHQTASARLKQLKDEGLIEAVVDKDGKPIRPALYILCTRKAEKPAPINGQVKSGTSEKRAESVPAHLMRGLLTPDEVGKGFALYNDVAGQPCSLAPDVSELEHRERAASMIGGSWKQKDLIAYEKWEKFSEQKIAQKVLAILKQMSPLEIKEGHRHKAFRYAYDLGKSSDLRELVTMLSAHLLRMADALELKEKYGHIK